MPEQLSLEGGLSTRGSRELPGPWSRPSPHEPADKLAVAATPIAPVAGAVAELRTREQGKVLWESKVDVGGAGHILAVSMPFGGVKASGIGRNHGTAALDGCTELQMTADQVDVSGFPGPNR